MTVPLNNKMLAIAIDWVLTQMRDDAYQEEETDPRHHEEPGGPCP